MAAAQPAGPAPTTTASNTGRLTSSNRGRLRVRLWRIRRDSLVVEILNCAIGCHDFAQKPHFHPACRRFERAIGYGHDTPKASCCSFGRSRLRVGDSPATQLRCRPRGAPADWNAPYTAKHIDVPRYRAVAGQIARRPLARIDPKGVIPAGALHTGRSDERPRIRVRRAESNLDGRGKAAARCSRQVTARQRPSARPPRRPWVSAHPNRAQTSDRSPTRQRRAAGKTSAQPSRAEASRYRHSKACLGTCLLSSDTLSLAASPHRPWCYRAG